MGFREHTLFWAALAVASFAVASFAYDTYVMAWSPAVAWPSDLPSWPVALGFYVACLSSVLMAFLARKN